MNKKEAIPFHNQLGIIEIYDNMISGMKENHSPKCILFNIDIQEEINKWNKKYASIQLDPNDIHVIKEKNHFI